MTTFKTIFRATSPVFALIILGNASNTWAFSCGTANTHCPPNMRCQAQPAGIAVGLNNRSAYTIRYNATIRRNTDGQKSRSQTVTVPAGRSRKPVCLELRGWSIDSVQFDWKDGLVWRDWNMNFQLAPGDHKFTAKGNLFQGVRSIK